MWQRREVIHIMSYRLSLGEQILSFKSRPDFEWSILSQNANRKSQKLLLFVKMRENHEDVLKHLNQAAQKDCQMV